MSNKIILQPDLFYGSVFGIVKTISGTYVCPGWHPVPDGTTREQIEYDMSKQPLAVKNTSEVKLEPLKEWLSASSKPGKFYNVSLENGNWECSCPAKMFNRGDCKHIKSIKIVNNF